MINALARFVGGSDAESAVEVLQTLERRLADDTERSHPFRCSMKGCASANASSMVELIIDLQMSG